MIAVLRKEKQMYKKIYTSVYVSYSCIVEVGNKAFFCCFSALNISVPNSDGAGKADDFLIFIGGEFSGKFRIVRKISARCILIHNADINGISVFSIQKTENIYGIVRMSRKNKMTDDDALFHHSVCMKKRGTRLA